MLAATATLDARLPACPAGATAPPLRIEVWDAARTAEAHVWWRRLEVELQHERLTSSTAWIETWLTHYRDLVAYRILVGLRGDAVVGLTLAVEHVAPQAGPLSIRTWHLGTAGEPGDDSVCVEFNSLLVRPDDLAEFQRAVQQTLLGWTDCDAVAWDGFDRADLPLDIESSSAWQARIKPTYYFDLRRAREAGVEPITLLGDSTRKSIRQNLRMAGEIHVDWSETIDQAEEYYADLVRCHQARWEAVGEPGSFASRAFREFHRALQHRLVPLERTAVVRVRAGRQTIGCNLLYFDCGRVLVYQGGWDQTSSLKSPGLLSDYFCLSECLRRGYDAFDFMAGDSMHKQRITTDQGRLVWVTYRKPSWKFPVVDRLRSAKRYLRSLWAKPKATFRKEGAS